MKLISKLAIGATIVTLMGCAMQGGIKNKTVVDKPDGTRITSTTTAKMPEHPASELLYTNTITGESLLVPKAQSEAEIEDVKQDGKNKRLFYAGIALIFIIGAVAFMAPNHLVSNKDASMVCLFAVLAFGAVRYVESSEKYMGYIIPVLIVGGAGWIAWDWVSNKKKEDNDS